MVKDKCCQPPIFFPFLPETFRIIMVDLDASVKHLSLCHAVKRVVAARSTLILQEISCPAILIGVLDPVLLMVLYSHLTH